MAQAGLGFMRKSVRRVSLEGIIGAGKSLFLAALEGRMAARSDTSLMVVDEPVKGPFAKKEEK